jgi:hypothetical protein
VIRVVVLIYRFFYVAVLLLFLLEVGGEAVKGVPSVQPALDAALEATAALVGAILCLLVVMRLDAIPSRLVWVVTSAWLALFTWYGWFSHRGLFLMHEAHSLDPDKVSAERARHFAGALAIFIGLAVFFLSFPVWRTISKGKRKQSF